MNKQKIVLAKRKRAELNALGINPKTYNVISTYLRKNVSYVVNEKGEVFMFNQNKEATKGAIGNAKTPLTKNGLKQEINKLFGLNSRETKLVVEEWLRDMQIYHVLSQNVNENWDILNVPIMYGTGTEGYNF